MIAAALAYAEKGWPIFPVGKDKRPLTKNGVLDATTDARQIESWWKRWPEANVALDVGGAGMMALDLDPGHDLRKLKDAVGSLPDTLLRARTPRGGTHLYYALAEGEVVAASASKLAPHVDVRSFHSYVLLPPSKTKDGTYTWEGEGRPAYRTDEMFRVANSARQKHEDRDNWLIDADLPENVALAVAWLRDEAKIAVDGQGGDHCAYATAAYLKSLAISEDKAVELILEHWNPRCIPSWSEDQLGHLEQKVKNAYAYNTSPPGNLTKGFRRAVLAKGFKPVQFDLEHGHEWKVGRFRFVNREGMSSIRPPEWLIENFLPQESYAILFGAPGTFKTFLALDIALSIAVGVGMGEDICWPAIANTGPVLFAAGEGRGNITVRVKAWEKTHFGGNEVENFRLADPVPLVSEELKPFIEGALAASPDGYKLVVLDTIGRAMQGSNENAQEHASNFTRMVERIQHELGATVLALHHTGFQDQHRARGSSVFGADADTIIRADKQGKNYLVSLTMTKQKDAPEWPKKRFIKLNEVSLDL